MTAETQVFHPASELQCFSCANWKRKFSLHQKRDQMIEGQASRPLSRHAVTHLQISVFLSATLQLHKGYWNKTFNWTFQNHGCIHVQLTGSYRHTTERCNFEMVVKSEVIFLRLCLFTQRNGNSKRVLRDARAINDDDEELCLNEKQTLQQDSPQTVRGTVWCKIK